MMSFRGQASWVKMMSPGGIGMPADQKSKKADLTKVVKPSTVVTVMYYQGSLTEGKAPCTK